MANPCFSDSCRPSIQHDADFQAKVDERLKEWGHEPARLVLDAVAHGSEVRLLIAGLPPCHCSIDEALGFVERIENAIAEARENQKCSA